MTKQAGFSLVELMVYITIVAILLVSGMAMYRGYIGRANESSANQDLLLFRQSIVLYQNDIGQYPRVLEDLIRKPTDAEAAKNWRNKYVDPTSLKMSDGKIVDPWDNPYHYRVTKGATNPFELYSDGDSTADNPIRLDAWKIQRK